MTEVRVLVLFCMFRVQNWFLPGPVWGPVRVGAQSGLGPGPGWGPYGPLWVLLDRSWQVRTCPISDFWSNFACFGFKIKFLITFLDDSAWLLLEKLKKHIFSIKNLNILPKMWKKILKISTRNYRDFWEKTLISQNSILDMKSAKNGVFWPNERKWALLAL